MAYIGNSPGNIQRGRRAVYEFTATNAQTVFSGADDNGISLDLQDSNENDVYLNGSRLIFNDDYTIAGEVLTLTDAAAAGDILVIVTQDDVANVASYTKAETDARYINYDGDIVNGDIQVVGNISLGDNNKINFGDGSDLHIYHNSSNNNSYISESGAGSLFVQGANIILEDPSTGADGIVVRPNAEVELYYQGSEKLATTNTGIDVTGNITFGDNHSIVSDNDDNLVIESSSSEDIIIKAGSGVVEFRDAGESGSPLQMKIDTDGNVLVGGNVNDTTPYNNSAGSTADNGIALGHSGIISAAKYNDSVLLLNRTGVNDGSIIDVKKNGNTVGTIGTVDGDLNVYATASGHKGLRFGNGYVAPTGNNTTVENGTTDLGLSTHRFKDLYMTGAVNANQYLLDAVAKDISATAVDVFVYDTRKDSDGGAWRKRTQNTSWYNETLNTATRGSRKEFPSVAVIVAESNQVTIYDGDDPDMPMWMVFDDTDADGSGLVSTGSNRDWTSVQMLNGRMAVGMGYGNTIGMGVDQVDFISDIGWRIRSSGGSNYKGTFKGSIAQRRDTTFNGIVLGNLVDETVNDVAMTVLPNAPIDAATGLPVPTIAVATDGGVSVIKDDGTVVSTASSIYTVGSIQILPTGEIYHSQGYNGNNGFCYNNNFERLSGMDVATYANSSTFWYAIDGIGNDSSLLGGGRPDENAVGEALDTAVGTASGLTTIALNSSSLNDGMVAYTTSDYNTGWMNGDIKLATLSDTDDTNLTDTNLVTNGTFSDGLNNWTLSGTTTPTISSSGGQFGGPGALLTTGAIDGGISQTLSLPSATYIINWLITQDNGGDFSLYINGNRVMDYMGDGGGTEQNFYIHTGSITNITIRHRYAGSGIIDSIWIQELKVQDRSANGNHIRSSTSGSGIVKTPVATGADLVGYRFSDNNHFVSPYNSDFDFGTNPFSITVWAKMDSVSNQNTTILDRSVGGQANAGRVLIYPEYSNSLPRIYIEGPTGSTYVTSSRAIDDGLWHCWHANRRGDGTLEIWIDGELQSKGGVSVDSINIDAHAEIRIGANWGGSSWFPGELSLLRISGTVPSTEQIKKIYNDEKFLFQENAKATLYGSSDAVTALAYDDDTELLHVGTSAGRSVFQGLRRIDNTTDAVGSAISASNGMVAED